ncbi:MAG: tRNA lysidine(34) synthetase TilS [Candidatus Neomarinimicrobiota bacterium]
MTETLERLFENHLESSGLVPRDSCGIVAVSGGPDSVALLDLLSGVASRWDLKLGVAHFNHGLRGKESDADERFVRELAEESGLAFYRSRLPRQPSTTNLSWEAYARRLRYRFLEKTREKGDFNWIATGHHGDDQAETVLMRVIEGSGIRGLKGIYDRRSLIIRPLLPFTRDQIMNYAERKHLLFRDDSSNQDKRFTRNLVRHELIPRIRDLNPGFTRSISRLTKNVQELDLLIESVVNERRVSIVTEEADGCASIKVEHLSKEPMIIQKRLIQRLTSSEGAESPWRHSVWVNLESFLKRSATGEIQTLPDGWRLLRDRDYYLLEKTGQEQIDRGKKEIRFQVEKHISFSLGHHFFEMDIQPAPDQFSLNSELEFADYDRLSGQQMVLRQWRSGDRMRPLGLNGYKKVSDILVDEKVSRFEKERQYVLVAGEDIVWLCGIRLDNRFRVQDDTQQVAKLWWRRH